MQWLSYAVKCGLSKVVIFGEYIATEVSKVLCLLFEYEKGPFKYYVIKGLGGWGNANDYD